MKFVTINWSLRFPNYPERMQAIGQRTNGWFNSALLNNIQLTPKD